MDSKPWTVTARKNWLVSAPSGGAERTGPRTRLIRESGLVIVLMMQLMPNTTDLHAKFLASVYQALVN